MRRIVFIGPCGGGNMPDHGAAFKNMLLLERLRDMHYSIDVVDTEHWRRHPWPVARLIASHLWRGDRMFVVSASRGSAYRISRLLSILSRNPIHYWVIGGRLWEDVAEGRFRASSLRRLSTVIVETESMARGLRSQGISNVKVIPNFKTLPPMPMISLARHAVTKFIFLSRITPEKGCRLIFEAVSRLNVEGLAGRFSVDFYGPVASDYRDEFFESLVKGDKNIRYLGVLDMTDSRNYDLLAGYDAMLFPTFWESEGFAGVLIDAFIAGLPVVATEWMGLPEIVKNEKTGILIAPRSADALTDSMRSIVTGEVDIAAMRQECVKEAPYYDIKNVLTPESLSFLR